MSLQPLIAIQNPQPQGQVILFEHCPHGRGFIIGTDLSCRIFSPSHHILTVKAANVLTYSE